MRPKLLLVLFGSILGIEQGKLELELVREHIARVPKSLYKERLTVHLFCFLKADNLIVVLWIYLTGVNLKKDSQVKLNLNLTCAGADKTKGSVVVKVVMRSTTCTGMNLLDSFECIYFYIT